jgi:glycosyltransferase involved in cell wall biosynthesis
MPRRHFLILTYYFPPRLSIGSVRWAAMSEWLRRLGHEVTVITSRFGVSERDDPWVLRTFDVGAVGSLRTLLGRGSIPAPGTRASVEKPAPRWFTDVLVPDELLLTWGPGALAGMRRALRERSIDCIVTTGPPQSTHLLPMLLGRRRPAWIVDLRDGWRFEPIRDSWPTQAQDRLELAIERRVLRSAERVIGATRPIALDAASRLGAAAVHIPNAWDPEDGARPAATNGSPGRHLDHDCINLVHTGTLSGGRGRDPRPVFEALARLAASRPAVSERLRLVLVGTLSQKEERLMGRLELPVPVEHRGSVTRGEALALQREADVLLLLTSPTHASEATGKLFEYLTAERPILALASENEAARIVSETGTGRVVHPHDVEGIVRALEAAVDGTLERSYAPQGLAGYVFPAPAEQVAALAEQAIVQRALARGRV